MGSRLAPPVAPSAFPQSYDSGTINFLAATEGAYEHSLKAAAFLEGGWNDAPTSTAVSLASHSPLQEEAYYAPLPGGGPSLLNPTMRAKSSLAPAQPQQQNEAYAALASKKKKNVSNPFGK